MVRHVSLRPQAANFFPVGTGATSIFTPTLAAPLGFFPQNPFHININWKGQPREYARYEGGEWKIINERTGELVPTLDSSSVREILIDFIISQNLQMIPCPYCRMPVKPDDLTSHCRAMADAGDGIHSVAEVMGI